MSLIIKIMWNTIAGCKEVAERDAIAEHLIHKQKLLKIKARVNNKPPKPMLHLKVKGKKKLEETKNLADIHHNNQILLDKLEKVKGSLRNAGKVYNNKPRNLSRAKFEEIVKIDGENNRLLLRIQSARSHYSATKHVQEFMFKKYLSEKLSENARRIPRVSSFNTLEVQEITSSRKASRPGTSAEALRINKFLRPGSAKMIKEGL
jgi:septum formation inhibitor MinC